VRRLLPLACLFFGLAPSPLVTPIAAGSQVQEVTTIPSDRLEPFARAHVAINLLRDRAHAELSHPKNKKIESQLEVRDKLRAGTAQVLKEHKLTEAEFARYTFLVSTDPDQRKAFEGVVAQLSEPKKST
jgi:hypothetical protein